MKQNSKMRQAIEKIAPQLINAGRVYVDGYSVKDLETGEQKINRYRMKWAEFSRGDLSFTEEQKKEIMKLPGVIRVDHTGKRKSGYYDDYTGTFYRGPVVTFTDHPSMLM